MAEVDANIDPAKKGSYEFSQLETYGDLKKLIQVIALKQKGKKIVSQGIEFGVDQLLGLFPGASNVKTAFDFFKSAISKPDTKKTNTWLDKLDIDDEMSTIVDDTVENGFMKAMTAAFESKPDTQPLEPNFNMNAEMVNYLKKQYAGRTVAGIRENKIMDIKEYIKDIVREIISEDELEEMSVSGDAGAYSTPYAFRGNKKGENAATKAAISQGFKKASTALPKNSKVVDYVKLFEDEYEMNQDPKTKEFTKRVKLSDKDKETIKKALDLIAKEKNKKLSEGNEWPEEVLSRHKDMKFIKQKSSSDKATYQIIDLEDNNKSKDSITFNSVNKLKDFADDYIKPQGGTRSTHLGENNISENIEEIVKEELIKEGTYSKFKNEVKLRSKNEMLHKAIKEVKRKLMEIDRIVEYTSMMKQELSEGEEGLNYWKATTNNVSRIAEMVNELNLKIQNLQQ
jgi:hypothetical protein